ncbi:potassium voltage-gated channel protein Shaw-like [Lineus longissimus]|uniref:potassium voltage-gated channel protein Shaw-like n=1 Tax=Lineus longissimus TaxID=88925 RepID=UPI002B4C347A
MGFRVCVNYMTDRIKCAFYVKMDIMKINVGGSVFQTERQTILNIPQSKLGCTISINEHYDETTGVFFFDRRPGLFESILSAHRDGEVHLPSNACGSELLQELEFWNIPETMVASCCFGKVKKDVTEREIARAVADEICCGVDESLEIRASSTGWGRKRMDTWFFMEFPVSSKLAKAWSIFVGVVLGLSLVTYGLMFDERAMYHENGTVIRYQHMFENITALIDTQKWRIIWTGRRHLELYAVDALLNFILIGEFVVRFAVCPFKKQFLRSFTNILDIIVIITYILGMFIGFGLIRRHLEVQGLQWLWLVCMVLQMLRPFRVVRLANTFDGLRVLLMVLRKSCYGLITVVLCINIGMMVFAFLIFAVEIGVEDTFKSVWVGAWWAVVTMTTVGYGDTVPKSTGGYAVGFFCTISGLVIIGLSIPVVTGGFNVYYDNVHKEMRKLQEKLRAVLVTTKPVSVVPMNVSTTSTEARCAERQAEKLEDPWVLDKTVATGEARRHRMKTVTKHS